jgi:pyrimidine deaminase RibD-like protein
MDTSEFGFIRMAIAEARKSQPEDGRVHPKVGVVVVRDGTVLASAHRGERSGSHAEFIALEKKLEETALVGATIYTTLEPCTSRTHPKVPCANRIAERKVSRVVIGMLDPNPKITGKGWEVLRSAGIATDLFPHELMAEVEELNRHFIRSHRLQADAQTVDDTFVREHKDRPLDDWYRRVNAIYWNRNFSRAPAEIFAHMVEVIGGFSLLASHKKKPDIDPIKFVPKSVAWWMALCGKVGVKSVSDLLWAKFPWICPYCQKNPHDAEECTELKAKRPGPDWHTLGMIGDKVKENCPKSLGDWQRMFSQLYQVSQVEDYGASFARLTEELGETAEALRIFPAAPGYFLSEAADVFAWLMHVQNIVDRDAGATKAERGSMLETLFCSSYPDYCLDCGSEVCSCPPILESTIGRIAHGVPAYRGSFDVGGNFMTADKAVHIFRPKPK